MIHLLINTLAEKMNDFLSSYYERAEIIVEAGSIEATPAEDQSDKIILSIVNIERETAMGISSPYRKAQGNTFQRTSPPWHLNIYIMVAAIFTPKRYLESIQILSDTISFLQQNPSLNIPGQDIVTLEPITTSMQELSNIWSILGGHYYPSVLCKARMISFDGKEIKDIKQRISSQEINLEKCYQTYDNECLMCIFCLLLKILLIIK